MRKLWPLKVKGVKNSKKKYKLPNEHSKSWFSNIFKKKLYVALLLLEFNDGL